MPWDPTQYARFGSERLRPALDLINRIPVDSPAVIIDLGCGSGNVTALLRARWPRAQVVGIDSSEAMLARATEAAPNAQFRRADIARYVPETPPALLYSNAALQWLPDHPRLLPRLASLLAPGGVLAVQMPAMDAAPYRALQRELAHDGRFAAALGTVRSAPPILAPEAYFDLLAPRVASVDIWETTYLHVLSGPDAVLQWAMGTSLRPYLDALAPPMRDDFVESYRAALRRHYPERSDETTILPFRRLFLVATART